MFTFNNIGINPLQTERHAQTESKGMEQEMEIKKNTPELVILISYKIYFKTKDIVRDKEGQFMIKGSICQEDVPL